MRSMFSYQHVIRLISTYAVTRIVVRTSHILNGDVRSSFTILFAVRMLLNNGGVMIYMTRIRSIRIAVCVVHQLLG
jgi:hypothetical protein